MQRRISNWNGLNVFLVKCQKTMRYKNKKVINVIATTNKGVVTKVQRIFNDYANTWYWGRICGGMRAWMPLPDSYKEKH